MRIQLPDFTRSTGQLVDYVLMGEPVHTARLPRDSSRTVFAAAHVVADPFTASEPSGPAAIDWSATLAYRRHLDGLGLGIAEAMDTAQRGMGLDWKGALELIRLTRGECPDALVFNGVGTDHLAPDEARHLTDVIAAYEHQLEAVQALDARVIVMASRALAKIARGPDDYLEVYQRVLASCERPVILHWLGECFDPALRGYWGSDAFDTALATSLAVIEANVAKVDGIKISLLDKNKEITMRRRLPASVKMYSGDDFDYPELIAGDSHGFSHALLGVFDPLATVAAQAVACLNENDTNGFHAALDQTVPLARHIFRAPTQYYKTGVVFLAWLNGHQDHFIMLGGAQAMRPLPYFVELFQHADRCGLLVNPDLAIARMKKLLACYGI